MLNNVDQALVEINELKQRVARLEELVSRMTGSALPPLWANNEAVEAEIRELVAQGALLNAIKVYKDHTNCSLSEAKNYIEAMLTKGS